MEFFQTFSGAEETRIIVPTGPVLNVLLMMTVMEINTVQMETVSVDQDQVQVQGTPFLPEHHRQAMMILYAITGIVLIAVPIKPQLKEVGKHYQYQLVMPLVPMPSIKQSSQGTMMPMKQPSNQPQHSTITPIKQPMPMPMPEFMEFMENDIMLEFMSYINPYLPNKLF